MAVGIKICGITSRDAAEAAIGAGADYAGLVFHSNSPRFVAPDRALSLAATLRTRTRIVALFADAGDYDIERVVRTVKPDLLQLHGAETPARVGALVARFGLPIIKAIGVADAADITHANAYEDAAQYLMFDAKGGDRAGGQGVAFDWKVLAERVSSRPWFLAGGLTPENVARAIQLTGAPLVDVSSGVESSLGVKSADKIRAFVAAARNAQYTDARS